MSLWLAVAAVLLALERACYVWIARAPRSFRQWCAQPAVARLGEPIAVVRGLFLTFKVLQAFVFAGWCFVYGGGFPTLSDDGVAVVLGAVLMLGGQTLSTLVF